MHAPQARGVWLERMALSLAVPTHTYLAGEIPWSIRWFTQNEAQPLHSGCADFCEFPKCGNLDCIISGSGGLRSRSPLIHLLKEQKPLSAEVCGWSKNYQSLFSGFGLMMASIAWIFLWVCISSAEGSWSRHCSFDSMLRCLNFVWLLIFFSAIRPRNSL